MYPVLPSIFPADPGSRYTEVLGDVGVDSGCGFQLLWTQNELLFGLGALVKKEALAGLCLPMASNGTHPWVSDSMEPIPAPRRRPLRGSAGAEERVHPGKWEHLVLTPGVPA